MTQGKATRLEDLSFPLSIGLITVPMSADGEHALPFFAGGRIATREQWQRLVEAVDRAYLLVEEAGGVEVVNDINEDRHSDVVVGGARPKRDRSGYVYLLHCTDNGYCKIGRSKSLASRLSTLGIQLPFKVDLIHTIRCGDMVEAEASLHKKFADLRVNGEWFALEQGDIDWIKGIATL